MMIELPFSNKSCVDWWRILSISSLIEESLAIYVSDEGTYPFGQTSKLEVNRIRFKSGNFLLLTFRTASAISCPLGLNGTCFTEMNAERVGAPESECHYRVHGGEHSRVDL